jgi:Mg2+ and Co2+ transporter CorA
MSRDEGIARLLAARVMGWSTDRLVTVRFMPLPAFDAVAGKFASSQNAPKSSLEMFTLLCEEIVDRVADILEQLAGELAAERRMVVVRRYSDCSLGRQMPGRREHELSRPKLGKQSGVDRLWGAPLGALTRGKRLRLDDERPGL